MSTLCLFQMHPPFTMANGGAALTQVMGHMAAAAGSPGLGSPVGSTTSSIPPPQSALQQAAAAAANGAAAANAAACSTLFVANLGPFSSEQELKELFNR